MNKSRKAKEITLGGSILLIIAGILFISGSEADSTGIMKAIGIVFIFGGIIGTLIIILNALEKLLW